MIQVGKTYSILDARRLIRGNYIGEQILVEEILDVDGDFLRVKGLIGNHPNHLILWARLGPPARPALCHCSFMTFPHKRTKKCLDHRT